MFYDPKQNEMILRLYAKAKTIGRVPSFDELDKMPDMPRVNDYALSCGSYTSAASIVERFLALKAPSKKEPQNSWIDQEEMESLSVQIKAGWTPIQQYVTKKSLLELLDEVMELVNPDGILPREFPVSFELNAALKRVCDLGNLYNG
ncbi:hypothetical protein IKE87_00220 [Candidatus Saccharibacteria bacterium]|nr:hypothetical protein [Candidatus Saccharibacteria bacterium]